MTDHQLTFDSPLDKFMLQASSFADDIERWRAQQRTYDAMLRKAMAGYVTGGRRFAYDNVEVLSGIIGPDGRPKRSHVELKINDVEAAVVVKIFEYCAGGKGYTSIAKLLNDEGLPCPRPNPGRPRAWAPSSVREILFRLPSQKCQGRGSSAQQW